MSSSLKEWHDCFFYKPEITMHPASTEMRYLNAIGTIDSDGDQVVILNAKERECVFSIIDNEVKALI